MTDTKSPLDQAVDLFFYAPVGLAVAARDLVPALIERGRQQVDPQVGVARMVGQMAFSQGRTQAEKAAERAMCQVRATLQQLGILPDEAADPPDARSGPRSTSRSAGADRPAAATTIPVPSGPVPATPMPPVAVPPIPVPPTARPSSAGEATVSLAIPDYESLSASQVVPRLSSLSPEELEAVRLYEEAHRGRKTILNKVAQIRTV